MDRKVINGRFSSWRSSWSTMLLTAAARGGAMIVSVVCGVLISRRLLGGFDRQVYATYTLMATIPSLITSPDLGTGAKLVNVVAASSNANHSSQVQRTLLSVQRILIISFSLILVGAGLLTVLGGWVGILGSAGGVRGTAQFATVSLIMFGVASLLSTGSRLLLGLGKQHIVVLIQGLQAPVALVIVFGFAREGTHKISGVILGPYCGLLFVVLVMTIVAAKILPNPYRFAVRNLFRLRSVNGERVMDVGVPMMVQTAISPVALQAHRFILAHWVSAPEIAEYSLCAQVFFAISGIVSASSLALWPMFRKKQEEGRRTHAIGYSFVFAGAAAGVCGIIVLIRGPVFEFISSHSLVPSLVLCAAFSLCVVVMAFLYPLGMAMMDAEGLKFQIVPVVAMTFVSVTGSISLVHVLGTSGPLVATAFAVLLCQIVPFLLRVHRLEKDVAGSSVNQVRTDRASETNAAKPAGDTVEYVD